MNNEELQAILEGVELDRYEFASTDNFERVLVEDPYHKAEEIYSYIEYYKKNIDKAICVFDEEENGIVYHNTLFILKDCYYLYTNWVSLNTGATKVHRWTVIILDREDSY